MAGWVVRQWRLCSKCTKSWTWSKQITLLFDFFLYVWPLQCHCFRPGELCPCSGLLLWQVQPVDFLGLIMPGGLYPFASCKTRIYGFPVVAAEIQRWFTSAGTWYGWSGMLWDKGGFLCWGHILLFIWSSSYSPGNVWQINKRKEGVSWGGNSNVCPQGTIRIGAQGAFLQHDCSVDTDSTQIYCSPHI